MTKFYDSAGNYKAYSKDDKHIFSDKDEHIGYIQNGFLYDPKGFAIAHLRGKEIIAKNGQLMFKAE